MVIKTKEHSLDMRSWHELLEAGGKTVATSRGLEALNGRTIDAALKQEPEEYQKYRRTWSALRQQIIDLIPVENSLAKGHVEMRAGIMSWVEP